MHGAYICNGQKRRFPARAVWDPRCVLHSRTPYKLYAPAEAGAVRGARFMHNLRITVNVDEAGIHDERRPRM
jgi:hypothetical protein